MSTISTGENIHTNSLNAQRAEQLAKKYPVRNRKPLPEFDDLLIVDAAELLVKFCLESPDDQTANITSRSLRSGITVATRAMRGAGIDDPEEDWISAIRVAKSRRNPFESASGLEIRLPYIVDVARSDWVRPHSSVQASYPYDGIGWNAQAVTRLHGPGDVAVSGELDIMNDTVKTLDDCITSGRPGSDDEWIEFHLAPTLAEIAGSSIHD